MNRVRLSGLVIAFILVGCHAVWAADAETTEKAKFTPVNARKATWVFSGVVTSENGEDYGYYFQMQRDNTHFHTNVALLDKSNKKVLFHEEGDATLDDSAPYDWHVGRTFLQFNPINASWIFGVKPQDNLGFNFKVDMLKQFENQPSFHHLRPGVLMMISPTSELNGHVFTGDAREEQFVTTKDAWFRQIWQDDQDTTAHELTSVLCQFNDGSRFYSVNLPESDAQSGAIAALYNPEGIRQSVSQFIQVSQSKEGAWHIQSQSPRLDLVLSAPLEKNAVIAGFVDNAKNPGFCMVNARSSFSEATG